MTVTPMKLSDVAALLVETWPRWDDLGAPPASLVATMVAIVGEETAGGTRIRDWNLVNMSGAGTGVSGLFRVFPVDGPHRYSDTWGAPRSGGRLHRGTDIYADEGTPVVAVADGRTTIGDDPSGGHGVELHAADRTRFYYAHLSAWEGPARAVKAGETIGYVGTTGNARGGPAHLHFEVHPDEGDPVNPFELLRESEGKFVPRVFEGPEAGARAAWALLLEKYPSVVAAGLEGAPELAARELYRSGFVRALRPHEARDYARGMRRYYRQIWPEVAALGEPASGASVAAIFGAGAFGAAIAIGSAMLHRRLAA